MVAPKESSEAQLVDLADILLADRYQVRKKLDEGTIDRYWRVLRAGNALPPIQLARVAGVLVAVDGWHRIKAYLKDGRTQIEATIATASEVEAQWMAAQANLTHGLPLKPSELRTVFRRFIGKKGHRDCKGNLRSYRQIAKDLGGGVSHVTIRNWMEKDYQHIFEAMGAGDEPHGNEWPEPPAEPSVPLKEATGALQRARLESQAVTDPHERGALVVTAEGLLWELQQGAIRDPKEF